MRWFKTKQVRNRIFYTIAILLIFQLSTFVRLPGITITQSSSSLATLLNLTSGGTLSRFGLLALGVSPFITASIIIQMLSKGVSKYYTELQTRGRAGQIKIAQHTRIWALIIGFIQGVSIIFTDTLSNLLAVQIEANTIEKVMLAIILSIGALFTTYLGDLINDKGIGNGQSLIISVGILSSLPTDIYNIILSGQYAQNQKAFIFSLIMLVLTLVVVSSITIIANKKEFHFNIQSKSSPIDTKAHYLPIKLLASSVVPIIFATSVLTIIQTIAAVSNSYWPWSDYNNYQGLFVYTLLIFIFTFVYNYIQVDSQRLSSDLIKSGTYIKNVSNLDTMKFLDKQIIRMSLLGAPVLSLIAGGSIFVTMVTPIDLNVSLTGVSILILVGTLQDTYFQIKGLTNKHNYKELIV